MGDRIEVPLELADFEVSSTELVDGWLEEKADSTFPVGCFHCGSIDVFGHGRSGRVVMIGCALLGPNIYRRARFVACGLIEKPM